MLANASVSAMVPASDLNRARRFYGETLGLTPTMEMPGGLMYDLGGTRFFLYETQFAGTAQHTVMAFDVADFDSEFAELRNSGVVFEEYDFPGLQTVDGVAEMDGNRVAWFKDTEGNILAVNEIPADMR